VRILPFLVFFSQLDTE
jgi:hypothetical protein